MAVLPGDGPLLSHSGPWREFMVSGKELVTKESITNYLKVVPSPLTLVLSKKKKKSKQKKVNY